VSKQVSAERVGHGYLGDVGAVDVGSVVVGAVDDGPVVVGDVGTVVVGTVVVGVVVVGAVVVGEVVAGDVGVAVVDGDEEGASGEVSPAVFAPPPTRLPSVVLPPDPAPVSSAADWPTTASKPVSAPSPRTRVATQLTATVGQLTGRRCGVDDATSTSSVSGTDVEPWSTLGRVGSERVANTGRVSLIASWLRSSECA
jgi:hypothetical protein